jgi:hypothetical protein
MKNYCLITFFLLPFCLHAQENRQKITVKKTQWKISISSPDSILWINKQNIVDIKVEGANNYAINIEGGTIHPYGNKYLVKVNKEGAATISVFEKLPANKKRVLFTKMYLVKTPPEPKVKVCGVAPDSVIDKHQLIAENSLIIFDEFEKQYLKVLGFNLVFSKGGKTQKYESKNCHFTIDMRNKIHLLESGTLLYFENIYCLMPDNSVKKLSDFQLFISDLGNPLVGK